MPDVNPSTTHTPDGEPIDWERRKLRALAWGTAPGYPYWREPTDEDLLGPPQDQAKNRRGQRLWSEGRNERAR